MSFNIPAPSEIQERLETESALSTGTQRAALAGTGENMITRDTTIASSELYGFIKKLSKQILPTTSESEYLDEHASFWLELARKSAASATGPVTVTGIDGAIIPAGSVVVRGDGRVYTFDADVTIGAGGIATGSVTAQSAGLGGNTQSGITLALSSPIVGISIITVGSEGLSGGADIESDASLLERVLDRVQTPPMGGCLSDYVTWAREVPGVTRAWPSESEEGVVTVLVTFVMDGKTDTIIPTETEVQAVADYIAGKRPAGARPEIFAPTTSAVNLSIALNPNTVAVQNAVRAELEDLFQREASAKGVTLYLSRISEAISIGAGESHHVIISPDHSLNFAFGVLPVLGDITWSLAG